VAAIPPRCPRPPAAAIRAIAAIGLAVLASPALAAKTDVVVLRNGDRLTGEVDQLERGKLQFKTDDMGTLQIEWDKVRSVAAAARFDVDDLYGRRYVGSLEPGASPGEVRIVTVAAIAVVPLVEIVRLRRIGSTFWRRLDGSIDAGASFTSASELFTADVAATIGLEKPGFEIEVDGTANLTTQPDVEDTGRSALSVSYARRYPARWVALASGQVEQNRELGFDLRSSAAVGGGRYLVQQQRQRLLGGVGVSLNREQPVEGEESTNVELTALLTYDVVSYDFPNLDVSVSAMGFASLTDSGRWRFEVDARLKREFVKDFYATLRGYESYDSRPGSADAAQNDYGVTFGLGWSF
jgi:hypothetical protein